MLTALVAMVLAGLVAGSASAQASPPNSSPEFPDTETGNRGVDENTGPGQNIGTPVAASDPDDDTLTYTLSGPDAAAFDIVATSGQLQTKAALDHESRDSHSVTVTATDTPGLSADIDMTITVANVDETATVSLWPVEPRVGTVLRATLSDPDGGVSSVTWRWDSSDDSNNWTNLSHDEASYTPTTGDTGKYLRASVSYRDAEGSGKSQEAVSAHQVGGREAAPDITVVEIVTGLSRPWDLAFTPDGTMLFTQIGGVLSSRLSDGTVQVVTADFRDLFVNRTAGLMAIVTDPDFTANRRFYTCQAHSEADKANEVQVIAWTINADHTEATRVADPLVGGMPVGSGFSHAGCRMRFGSEGYLWIATGDGYAVSAAQSLSSLGGKVLRVDASMGTGAPGNSIAESPRVYTYGHRNPQGLALRPGTTEMWLVEHGPDWDDEINLLALGGNYGWDPSLPNSPTVYDEAVPMTDLEKFPAAVEARWSSGVPTLATSGGIFLEGADWEEWNGRLVVAALAKKTLRVFEFTPDGDFVSQVVVPELDGTYERLRTPMLGPDGALYVTTSNGSGDLILKIAPSRPPAFPPSETGQRRVVENTRLGQNIGAPVAAADPDGDTLTYTLGGSDAAAFEILASSGQLRTKAALDFETKSAYSVTVTAADPYDLAADIDVTITVTGVDEAPVVTGPAIASHEENATRVVASYTAADPDGPTSFMWSLSGDDADDFDISSGGVLTFMSPPDFEAAGDTGSNNVYDVTVRASDGSNTGTHAVKVTVTNLDDEAPVVTGPASRSFAENGTASVATYTAADPDGPTSFMWSLSGDDADDFDISSGGVLTFMSPPDFENPSDANQDNDYIIRVEARDDGFNTAALDVTVTVTNSSGIEEPTITTTGGPSSFPENGTGTVYVFRARDPQGGPISWMVTGTDSDVFAISSSGVLTFVSPPDYENPSDSDRDNSYEIRVVVTDDQGLTDSVDVTVTVTRGETDVVWGERLADRDIALPGVSSPSGVWSDGTDVWVVTTAGRVSVYSLADGAEHTDRGFTLPGGAEYAAGLWSNGATLWVADVNSGWVRAYGLSDGVRQADRDLDTAGNTEPAGIWSDGTTMWVADFTDSRVYAYDLATKARVADKELDLDKNPGEAYNPFGIWSNGDTLLAASWFGSEIIAHSLTGGQRQPAIDLSTFASRTNSPNGIWSNGHILWVVDASDATLYAYAVPGLGAPDTASWAVVADPARVAEGQASTVTVSVDKTFETAQTIALAATGGTAAGIDYRLSSSSVTLDGGDSEVSVSVTAVDDSVFEGDETVVVTASHDGGAVGSATLTIAANDTPTWSVVADPARVAEGQASTVTVSVDKTFETAQTIALAATGGTAAGTDYTLSSSVTLDGGATEVSVSVTAVDDSVFEGDETVVVTASHDGGAVGSATVTIAANDTPTWSVVADPATVAEGQASTVTVSVDKTFDAPQTITLAATGGTAAGTDYTLSSSVRLAAGAKTATAVVTAVDDSVFEGDETVVVTASHDGGAVGSATVTIAANDTPTWSVVADPATVAEGQASTVTVSVDKTFETAQTITLAATGGTAAGTDYTLSSSVTLAAGAETAAAVVTAVDDNDEESDETVVVTASHDGGAVGSATFTIAANDTPTWSVVADPTTVAEGQASTVTVSVDKTFESAQTIALAATGGTAAGTDYTLSSSSVTLDGGDSEVSVSVTAVDDSVFEGDETVVVTASHDGGAVGSATLTIAANDTPTWSVVADPATVAEGQASTVTVSVDKTFETAQTIALAATGGTAAGTDYTLSSSVTLDGGATEVSVSVTAVDDSVFEGDETVVVTASHDGGAVGSATVTIAANDTPTWSVVADPATVAEGQASTVTVSVDKTFETAQTIALAATGGTAAGTDYTLSPSVRLAAGAKTATAVVTAVDDSVFEGDETVVVTASHDGGAVGSATVTIAANDTPTWSVVADPATVAEGQASTVTVSVDKTFETAQTITLAATGTAAGTDYTLSSSVTLAAGAETAAAVVTAVDDNDEESDETVVVTASHDGGAVGSATVTIAANDTPTWSVTADPATVAEGQASTVTVSVDKTFETAQTIALAATGGTAARTDYTLSSSVTLDAGDSEVSVSVTAVDDSVFEGDETVVVTASHDGGAVGSATVTIAANDTPTWSVTADPATVAEGQASTVTVSVDKTFDAPQTIALAATGGTAAGTDYTLSSSVTLDAGDSEVSVSVTAVDDSVIEGGDETVVVTASHGGGSVGSATVTIADNDTAVWSVTAEPARVAEGAASTITVSVDKAFDTDQTITLAVEGTAAGSDYSLSSSVTLHAGDTSVTATMTAVDDSVIEGGDETVVVTARHGGGAVGSATVTIADNDTAVWSVTAVPARVVEGAASTITVSVDKAFDTDQTIALAATGGTAAGTDYTLSPSTLTLTLAAGAKTATAVVTAVDDNDEESDETVVVTASHDGGAVGSATITIEAVAPLPPGVVWGDRLADRDIALPGAPTGVWSDGTDVWVVTTAGRVSVYSLADGAEHTDRGFTLPGGAEYAAGLWSNGATLWVADVNSGWVRAYGLSDGVRQADRDLDTAALAAAGNGEPAGIWSNGTTMWVADFTDSRVYAYDLASKARVVDKELDLDKNPGEAYNPFGIWSNGDTLLAASWFGSEIIAHSLADGQRQPAKDLSTFASRTNSPNGIWSKGHILWVVDSSAATLYAYAVPGLGAPPNDTAGSGD